MADDVDRFLDWFAGFVAADGCFLIRQTTTGYFHCSLDITLRDDDLPLLTEIQKVLGMGNIAQRDLPAPASPIACWRVNKINDLVRLVTIFDVHSLRSKKKKHYDIWREAVLEMNGGQGRGRSVTTYDRERLAALCAQLSETKLYGSV